MPEDVVIVEKITKRFKTKNVPVASQLENLNHYSNGHFVALDNVSFKVSKGEMLGIIGLNGSGKTTLLRTIAGLYQLDSGKISIQGRMAPLLQIGTGFKDELTATENIIISGMLIGFSKSEIKQRIPEIIKFAELGEFLSLKLKHYSTGMRARLAFSTSLQVDPDIMLVDEILAVGDISFLQKSFNEFLSFKERGKTILYTTHNLLILPKLCDRVLLLHHGKAIMVGPPDDVIAKYKEISAQK